VLEWYLTCGVICKYMLVPRDYLIAKKKGFSKEALLELVQVICLRALRQNAANKGQPEPDSVHPAVVLLTYDMYEYALRGDDVL